MGIIVYTYYEFEEQKELERLLGPCKVTFSQGQTPTKEPRMTANMMNVFRKNIKIVAETPLDYDDGVTAGKILLQEGFAKLVPHGLKDRVILELI